MAYLGQNAPQTQAELERFYIDVLAKLAELETRIAALEAP